MGRDELHPCFLVFMMSYLPLPTQATALSMSIFQDAAPIKEAEEEAPSESLASVWFPLLGAAD